MKQSKNITLYTIGCPKCKILEKKLDKTNIQYEINENIEDMKDKGLTSAPALEVDGKMMNFTEAIAWVNQQGAIKNEN